MSVTPNSGTALLGETLTFSAEVSNTTDTAVSWSVNHILGGSAQVGAISTDGVYTAPADLPAGGTSAADICLFSMAGFDTSMSYTISGPGGISVISKQPAGLGIIHLTLQILATAIPGDRTLFIQNANLDRAAASGVLQIQ